MAKIINHTMTLGAGASAQMLGPNPARKKLIISSASAGDFAVSFGAAGTLNQGLRIPQDTAAITISDVDCPGALQDAVFVRAGLAGVDIAILEFTNP